ncbi:MAG TPA: exosortase-associated EpsI family protein [Pirellulales bacterium]|nr:exosortase-associated EpsI family protein [Pirellulales bacterium]
MSRAYLPWLILFAATAGSGAAAGKLGNRWGTPPDMSAAAERLARLPAECGEWQLVDERPLDEGLIEMLQCAASTNRTYRNRSSGETVHISLIVGPPGPTSVHTPEICFSSQGYHIDVPAERRRFSTTGKPGDGGAASPANEFWQTTFAPDNRQPDRLVACYGWCDGRRWLAPDHPRFAFAGAPFLYKMQLAMKISIESEKEGDLCGDFLRSLLPALAASGFYTD